MIQNNTRAPSCEARTGPWKLWRRRILVWGVIGGISLGQTPSAKADGNAGAKPAATDVEGGGPTTFSKKENAGTSMSSSAPSGTVAENIRRTGDDLRMALIHLDAGQFDRAQRRFESYITRLPEDEQRLYRDLSLVAARDELKIYRHTPGEQKETMIRRFWNRHDPAPLTRANERLLEHYRRVAFARKYFSADTFPWDVRGQVYIRFGSPTHISRSGDIRVEQDPRVMKARAAFADRLNLDLNTVPGHPTFPVQPDVRWEYWVYLDIDGGIELTFVSLSSDERYIFAPSPVLVLRDRPALYEGEPRVQGITDRLLETNASYLMERLTAVQPSRYTPGFADLPVDFACDPIGFQGPDGRTHLEIACGLPASDAVYLQPDDRTGLIGLERGLVLYDNLWNEACRVQDRVDLNPPTVQKILEGAFIPTVIRADLAPGAYTMALQIRDAASGKSRVYHREVAVEDYAGRDGLCLSGVQVAFSVAPADSGEEYVKKGLRVIPQASRTFRQDQHAFVYFEIYNLSRDAFGRTRYRVEYALAAQRNRPVPTRILRGLGRLLGLVKKDHEVVIAHDQDGDRPDETAYVALDLAQTRPGQQIVRVAVRDLLGGQKVSREATFTIVP